MCAVPALLAGLKCRAGSRIEFTETIQRRLVEEVKVRWTRSTGAARAPSVTVR